MKIKLLTFCLNIERYLGYDVKSDSSIDDIMRGDGENKPTTLGEKYLKAKNKNGIPLLWQNNDLLIRTLITARNVYVHTGKFEDQTKLNIELAEKNLSSLFIPPNIIKSEPINKLLNVGWETSSFLKNAFKCENEDLGQICIELYYKKEFKNMLQKVWDFARLRNKVLHKTLYLGTKDMEQLNKFRKYINNEISKWNERNDNNRTA